MQRAGRMSQDRGVRLAIISDTHLPRGARRLPDACLERLRAADLILHAGDFTTVAVLDDLEALGPPVAAGPAAPGARGPPAPAVHGNIDGPDVRARLPERRIVEAGGARIGMIHDAG